MQTGRKCSGDNGASEVKSELRNSYLKQFRPNLRYFLTN